MSAISVQEYETRIQQLEKLNATLAAEIDLMSPVVSTALRICRPPIIHASLLPLQEAVNNYKAAKRQRD